MKAIKEINPSKSSEGPDSIHPKVVFECREELCGDLNKLYMKSLDTNI
jgi:hypothetical protein